jgi:hypothetical protein
MDLGRFQRLLETYGADPEHWPAEERDLALALVARSATARAHRDEAARLDALLDAVPAAQPSPELVARVLAAAPRAPARAARPVRRWPWAAAAASLAAAAALTLWLRSPAPQGTAPLTAQEIATLGVLDAPSDALLAAPGGGLVYGVPDVGCEDSALGCPDLDTSPEETSDRGDGRATA